MEEVEQLLEDAALVVFTMRLVRRRCKQNESEELR
jgi:hypothetical protein